MDILELGRQLLLLASVTAGAIALLSLLGIVLKSRRCVLGARTACYVLAVLVVGSSACLIHGFITGQYNNDYIYNYSERLLPFGFRFACLWAGLDGSLLFWTALVSAAAAVVAFQHRWSSRHPTGRRLEPYVYLVLSQVILFFCLVTWHQNPFDIMPLEERLRLAAGHKVPIDEAGNLLDGAGLNQQLVNYWFVIHPPTLYAGFVLWTIPFAYALAALLSGELGDYWIRIVRRWSMVAWLFLTSGIILGGLWAYRQLGWGGYWAWDPVENASFIPWCTGTAFLHSIMIQERRDMLRGWNVFLILLTFFLTIVGTWMTRSGVVNSVHSFSNGDIGIWFQAFLFLLAAVSLFCYFYRARQLRGSHRLESLLSRESAFLFNNFILVVIGTAVFFLSFFDKIAHDWFASDLTQKGMFEKVVIPCFAVLLFLTGAGPSLGWVKTSGRSLRTSFGGPILAATLATLLTYGALALRGLTGTWSEMLVPAFSDQHPSALYPTGVFVWLSYFIVSTVGVELLRGLRSRMQFRKEALLVALVQLVLKNNRRWGGYVVHVGIAILTLGITASSMFKIKEEGLPLDLRQAARVGPYVVTPVEERIRKEPMPGEPYEKDEVLFRVTRSVTPTLPVAHGQQAKSASARESAQEAEVVAELWGERRFYPKKAQWINEVSIERKLLEDVYVYFEGRDERGRILVTVFLNPLMMLIYLGWFVMIGGALFATLPIPGSKVGLAE